jgi:LysR family glycine cleavage system transcriptional activator
MMRKTDEKPRLPSLRALQVFAVAARHGSFTRAAHELHLTQGAVSRQVQELETALGRALFVRSGPQLSITVTGQQLGADVQQALEWLRAAVDRARPARATPRITLSMLPSVAAKWMAPRLARFVQDHPHLDLRITASRHFVDFQAEEVDAAIRYGRGAWPGLTATHLCNETVFPVCSPGLAQRLNLQRPADLLSATLLHSDIAEDWLAWFQAAGVGAPAVPRGPTIGDDAAMLQAVIDGQGVALGRSVLVADDLAQGRLVAPFPQRLPASYHYWFVAPESAPETPGLTTVREWLIAEFAPLKYLTDASAAPS